LGKTELNNKFVSNDKFNIVQSQRLFFSEVVLPESLLLLALFLLLTVDVLFLKRGK